MALKRISDLTGATLPLTGAEELELDVAGAARKCTAQDIADLGSGSGSGDVVGPSSATDSAVALFDGSTGKLIKNGVTVSAIKQADQNSQSSAYTLLIGDAGKHIYHPSADTTARIWTIPANSSVAFPVGTMVTFVNDTGAGVITIAITTDTLVLSGAGTTGSRSLAANGIATAIKISSTRWMISGTGLT